MILAARGQFAKCRKLPTGCPAPAVCLRYRDGDPGRLQKAERVVSGIIAEKLDQAHAILGEQGVGAWIVFVRESSQGGDPVLPLVYDGGFTWQSALIVTRNGDRVAVVGQLDDGAVRASGVWTEVIPYVKSIREPLVEVIRRLDPDSIAIDFSLSDYSADGLSHGMFMLLQQYFADTPYADRFVSAEGVVGSLRGRKSPAEVERMRTAIKITEAIFSEVSAFACPGRTEREVAQFLQTAAQRRGVELAWEPPCPIVNSGPESMVGHGVPGDIRIEPGHVLHIDFGVRYQGYCSDLQRCWYVPGTGQTSPPLAVRAAFDAVAEGIRKAADFIQPGVKGWEVDAVARKAIVDAGFPEYEHALGHQVGRSAHDGGTILGPQWPRYGETSSRSVEVGNVFTLEPSILKVGTTGCIGLEEMVLVAPDGCQWLSQPQTTLPCLGRSI